MTWVDHLGLDILYGSLSLEEVASPSQKPQTTCSSSPKHGSLCARPCWHLPLSVAACVFCPSILAFNWCCHCAGLVHANMPLREHGCIFPDMSGGHSAAAGTLVLWLLKPLHPLSQDSLQGIALQMYLLGLGTPRTYYSLHLKSCGSVQSSVTEPIFFGEDWELHVLV